ncbi:MAG: hypothetical protein M5R37_10150 [Melioribacteraceae bacterium]|nr:hypothetical protein [Melioribacteraceae bacterium]
MLTENEIEKIIKYHIERTEKLGEQSGGSGHLAYVSYNLLDYEHHQLRDGHTTVNFRYVIFIETEFICEPDNPPMQTEYEKEMILNRVNEVISERTISEKCNWLNDKLPDHFWQDEKNKIMIFIEELLAKIEWQYGDNRAPIKYPPKFSNIGGKFICRIELENAGGELVYESRYSSLLYDKVTSDLKKRFSTRR